jgi:hypothetical protein
MYCFNFQEADTDTLVPFVHASADDKNGNSLPGGGEGFGWPRYVDFIFQNKYVSVIFCCINHYVPP